MRHLKYLLLLAFLAVPAIHSHAQVAIGVQIGPNYGLYNAPPVCPYGYYPDYPFDCAPYGYWGPEWFVNDVFIGAGPWYHFYYTQPVYWGRFYSHPYYRGYAYRDWDHDHFYGGRRWDHDRDWDHDRGWHGNRGFRGEGFHGGDRFANNGGGGFRGEDRGFRGNDRGFRGGNNFRGGGNGFRGGDGGRNFRGGGEFRGGGGFRGGDHGHGGGRDRDHGDHGRR